jgi:hypothetical protein
MKDLKKINTRKQHSNVDRAPEVPATLHGRGAMRVGLGKGTVKRSLLWTHLDWIPIS